MRIKTCDIHASSEPEELPLSCLLGFVVTDVVIATGIVIVVMGIALWGSGIGPFLLPVSYKIVEKTFSGCHCLLSGLKRSTPRKQPSSV